MYRAEVLGIRVPSSISSVKTDDHFVDSGYVDEVHARGRKLKQKSSNDLVCLLRVYINWGLFDHK